MKRKTLVFKVLGLLFIFFGLFAIGGSIFLWGAGFYFNFPNGVDLALPSADLFVNGPASILTGIGLWKTRKWGYVMAWFTAGFYLYASVEVFVFAIQDGNMTPEIFIPQSLAVAAAIIVMLVTWKWQDHFNSMEGNR
jgi:hypothetical protein